MDDLIKAMGDVIKEFQVINFDDVVAEYKKAKREHMILTAEIDNLQAEAQSCADIYNGCLQLMIARVGKDKAYEMTTEIKESLQTELAEQSGIKPRKLADAIWTFVKDSGNKGATVDEIKEQLERWGFAVEGNNSIYTTLHRFSNTGSKGRKLKKIKDRYYVDQ